MQLKQINRILVQVRTACGSLALHTALHTVLLPGCAAVCYPHCRHAPGLCCSPCKRSKMLAAAAAAAAPLGSFRPFTLCAWLSSRVPAACSLAPTQGMRDQHGSSSHGSRRAKRRHAGWLVLADAATCRG